MSHNERNAKLISVKRIWDHAEHNGMTDLIDYQGTLLCCFREGVGHRGNVKNGSIRILTSQNGDEWKPAALLSKPGFDLRDPHFSIMPDGRLMLTLGGSIYQNGEYQGCYPHVAFSSDGFDWPPAELISLPEEWIWQVSWHAGEGYGFSYRLSQPKYRDEPWVLSLFKTKDGLSYKRVKEFTISGYPSEATIRFTQAGEATALLRRRGHAWIGASSAPYDEWRWSDCGYCVGGPNFIILPDSTMWAAGRDYDEDADDSAGFNLGSTYVGSMTKNTYKPLLCLPSGGDNSYPGLVYKDHKLLVSYYSSHEDKTSIYLAQLMI